MVSTYTPYVNLEEPARGDYVGTWDTPVNANTTLIDLILGGRTTISGAAGNVVLASAQFQCKTITFNSTLLASITVTFPTSFTKSYEIYNACTGSSLYTITLQTTAAGGQVICAPPGEIVEMVNDGTNIRFKNLARVGSFWDYAGSSVPAWVSGCTVPPYLNCDGSAVSSAIYPVLFSMIGSTLPDSRGRVRAPLNQTTNRLLSSYGGLDGNTNLTGGGADNITLGSSNLPGNIPINDAGHTHGVSGSSAVWGAPGAGTALAGGSFGAFVATQISAAVTGITVNPSTGAAGTSQFHSNVQPTYVAGITMIRAG